MTIRQRIAIFDLDETLTKKGTWGRFVTGTLKGKPLKWLPFLTTSLFRQALYMAGLAPREHVKESMMRRTLSGKPRAQLERLADAFAEEEVRSGLRKRARKVLQGHQAQGDRILIASAAVDLIVEPIARRLGIDEIVCTKMAWDEEDKCARRLGGMNCYGPDKLRMVRNYLERDPDFRRDEAHITIYSDSASDLDILRWADVGIAVNPSPRLARLAPQNGFEVQDWDKDE